MNRRNRRWLVGLFGSLTVIALIAVASTVSDSGSGGDSPIERCVSKYRDSQVAANAYESIVSGTPNDSEPSAEERDSMVGHVCSNASSSDQLDADGTMWTSDGEEVPSD